MTSELRRASHPGRGIGESGFLRAMVGGALWVATALAILSVGWVAPATAVAFGVDSTVDAVDANPGDGICAAASGACTLAPRLFRKAPGRRSRSGQIPGKYSTPTA